MAVPGLRCSPAHKQSMTQEEVRTLRHRIMLMGELMESEERYVGNLQVVEDLFFRPLQQRQLVSDAVLRSLMGDFEVPPSPWLTLFLCTPL